MYHTNCGIHACTHMYVRTCWIITHQWLDLYVHAVYTYAASSVIHNYVGRYVHGHVYMYTLYTQCIVYYITYVCIYVHTCTWIKYLIIHTLSYS